MTFKKKLLMTLLPKLRLLRHAGLLLGLVVVFANPVTATAATVNCGTSPVHTPSGGGSFSINVDCTISGLGVSLGLQIIPLVANQVSPSSASLTQGSNTLGMALQPTVSSPDGSAINLLGTAGGGFTALVAGTPAKLRFQYTGTTTSTTPAGTYTLSSGVYNWNLNLLASGTSNFSLQAIVPVATICACNSPTVNTTGGGGAYTATVICTVSGNHTQLSPAGQNLFSPASITLSNAGATLNASLQPAVTSPDGSVTGITGTAAGGFSGTVTSLPARVQVQYTGSTVNTTKSGTYSSPSVTYNRSAI